MLTIPTVADIRRNGPQCPACGAQVGWEKVSPWVFHPCPACGAGVREAPGQRGAVGLAALGLSYPIASVGGLHDWGFLLAWFVVALAIRGALEPVVRYVRPPRLVLADETRSDMN